VDPARGTIAAASPQQEDFMLTQKLAQAVLEQRAFAPDALNAARAAFVDTLGVALAGSTEDCARIAQDWVREAGAAPRAAVWGTSLRGTPADAAFANGIAGHALDFDDSLPTLRGHPSITLVPAILAAAEAGHSVNAATVTGKAALEAYVIGTEIAGIFGKVLGQGHYLRGWHTTATVGTLAAAAAAARVMGLDVGQLRNAFGIAASQSAGIITNLGTMTKPFHAGNAARSAIVAVTLARSGFTANASVFDGAQSFITTYAGEDGVPLADCLAAFGAPWQVMSPGIYVKRWALLLRQPPSHRRPAEAARRQQGQSRRDHAGALRLPPRHRHGAGEQSTEDRA
jgi:2-methylcitrate dehydratase PrpD